SYPWRTICKLEMTANDDTLWVGSGAIINNHTLLTCAHCIYMHDHGGWVKSVKVTPGMDNGVAPYGHVWANYYYTYSGWINYGDDRYDLAVLNLDSDIGLTTGWMGIKTADPSSQIYTGTLNTAGYPADLDGGLNLYSDSDNGRIATEYRHWYYMDTMGGQSGSPVWEYNGTHRYILTVHGYGDDGSLSNHGTRINQDKYNDIMNWIEQDIPQDNEDLETLLLSLALLPQESTFEELYPYFIIGGVGVAFAITIVAVLARER
ncbi:MAG: trypsin-like serine peptidase, partial [Candidatus Helarchaeota archaeon]